MKKIFLFLLTLILSVPLFSQVSSFSSSSFARIVSPKAQYPIPENKASDEKELEEIKALNENIKAQNEIWKQYQKDIERQRMLVRHPSSSTKDAERPHELFYAYTVQKDKSGYLDTYNGLYARFQTQHGTLVSINRLSSPDSVTAGRSLILPVMQGLFIPQKPLSTLEILMQKEFSSQINENTPVYEIDGTGFYYLEEINLSPTLFAYFHDSFMQLPLSKKIVTSGFGYRVSPITGKWKFHAGIDLAAPEGTEVYACKQGKVKTAAYSDIYGNYIVLSHNNSTTSLYAHLSQILVQKNESVATGQKIGLTGTTGASTGPHLHFEVRENGTPMDPSKMIKTKKQ